MSRPKANSNFFKTWSHNMSYILGFIVTDGCLVEHKNGYNCLNITNKNREILEAMLRALGSTHKISIKSRGDDTPDLKYFQIQIRDRTIYSDLLSLGLIPRKSKIIRMPIVPTDFFSDFVRGCFDGDGSVTVWQDPRWKHPWQIKTVFSSASHVFLTGMQKRLHDQCRLSFGSIQNLAREYNLCYSIADSIKLCDSMYRNIDENFLYLKRKLDKFVFFKQIRPDIFEKKQC